MSERPGRVPGFDEAAVRRAVAGRRVLLTGHTGFKGGWLALWLHRLGASVTGIALPPPPGPSLFESAGIASRIDSRLGDIRVPRDFNDAVGSLDADIVIHMAAQAVVRRSHADPIDTWATNVVGTAVVLEAARKMPSLRAIVVITSDKCYENREWEWGYRETDTLGGADPYSASKAGTELVAASYRRSFFAAGPPLATARAGNVFGGGDWAEDRLVPDIVRAVAADTPVLIRNPGSIRPWQHVLDCLAGYLTLTERLVSHGAAYAGAWNFGPDPAAAITVETLATMMANAWGHGGPRFRFGNVQGPHEARLLALDSARAQVRLGWRPVLAPADAITLTTQWYRAWLAGDDIAALSAAQLANYVAAATPPHSEHSGDRLHCA